MKRLSILTALIFLGASMASAEEGFVPLFNGKDLTGWEVKENKAGDPDLWTVKNGVVTARPGQGWLGTKAMYGDFILRLEWRLPENGNSGVYLRVPDVRADLLPTFYALEIQVLDDSGPQYQGKLKPYQYSGSIYEIAPASKHLNKGAGQWNRFEITCRGDRVKVDFNGETVVDADARQAPELGKRPKRGFLGFQNHSSSVEYRNVTIKVLEEAPPK